MSKGVFQEAVQVSGGLDLQIPEGLENQYATVERLLLQGKSPGLIARHPSTRGWPKGRSRRLASLVMARWTSHYHRPPEAKASQYVQMFLDMARRCMEEGAYPSAVQAMDRAARLDGVLADRVQVDISGGVVRLPAGVRLDDPGGIEAAAESIKKQLGILRSPFQLPSSRKSYVDTRAVEAEPAAKVTDDEFDL